MPEAEGPGRGDTPMTYQPEQRWVEIRQFRQLGDAQQHALVLIAMSINCMLVRRPWGIGLVVAVHDAARAEEQLDAYEAENAPRVALEPAFRAKDVIDASLIAALLVVFTQMAADGLFFGADWYHAGAANAGLIRGGEWWRAITALGLHGDLGHIASNLVFGGVLGVIVAQVLGAGLGWLSILLSGFLGNLANAMFQSAGHTAIGASTAVFGALGLAASLAWQRQTVTGPGLRRWAPLGAGVMLLAFMGVSGERTDIGAHLAGFGVGSVMGFLLHQLSRFIPQGQRAQRWYAAAAAGLFAGAWTIALV